MPDPYASNEHELGKVLELLSEPRDVDGVTRWLLPNLKILKIARGRGRLIAEERFVSMIRNRYVDHGRWDTYEPPVKLQSLYIEGVSSLRDVMDGILGQGVLRPS
ncbi:hypothetical protein FRB95_002649 [Tulasnella sp. JGI-2019a]|nr:hypothetical protein FRB95_002649 [Tulasnella sp. JGI-2019a]